MAKRKDPTADALARLAELKTVDDRGVLAAGLSALLSDKSGYVLARAAAVASERGVRDARPAVLAALDRILTNAKADDAGCAASLALVQALIALEADRDAEEVALRATRYARWEAVWGGSVDVAVSVRGHAVILLAAMGSARALAAATELLAEPDQPGPRERASAPARSDAARALTMIGSTGAAAVLHFKALIGDPDANVLGDCLGGLLTLDRDVGLPLVERLLASDDSADAEAAALALGGWRDRQAFVTLQAQEQRFLNSPSRELYLASVAMTRDPRAVDYLIELAQSGRSSLRSAALTALEPLRLLPGVEGRLESLKLT